MNSRQAKKQTKKLLQPLVKQLQVIDSYYEITYLSRPRNRTKKPNKHSRFWLDHRSNNENLTVVAWVLKDDELFVLTDEFSEGHEIVDAITEVIEQHDFVFQSKKRYVIK